MLFVVVFGFLLFCLCVFIFSWISRVCSFCRLITLDTHPSPPDPLKQTYSSRLGRGLGFRAGEKSPFTWSFRPHLPSSSNEFPGATYSLQTYIHTYIHTYCRHAYLHTHIHTYSHKYMLANRKSDCHAVISTSNDTYTHILHSHIRRRMYVRQGRRVPRKSTPNKGRIMNEFGPHETTIQLNTLD